MWLHGGLIHLFANLLGMYKLGGDLERDIGPIRLAAIYLISGIAGNVFGALFAPINVVSVGASTAIFG